MYLRSDIFTTVAALACALLPCGVRAATAPGINPTADTFVSSGNPTGAYGGAGALSVSPSVSAKGELDTFIRFNLATTKTYFDGIYGAGNWTVQSITLQLTTANPNNAIFNNPNVAGMFNLTSLQSATSDAWVEGTGSPMSPDTTAGTLNFNNHSNYLSAGSDVSAGMFTSGSGTSGANTFTLTLSGALVANALAGTDTDFYLSAADTTVAYTFNSSNFGTTTARPLLTVSAVPEPASLAILSFAGGLFALASIVRRRRV